MRKEGVPGVEGGGGEEALSHDILRSVGLRALFRYSDKLI